MSASYSNVANVICLGQTWAMQDVSSWVSDGPNDHVYVQLWHHKKTAHKTEGTVDNTKLAHLLVSQHQPQAHGWKHCNYLKLNELDNQQ